MKARAAVLYRRFIGSRCCAYELTLATSMSPAKRCTPICSFRSIPTSPRKCAFALLAALGFWLPFTQAEEPLHPTQITRHAFNDRSLETISFKCDLMPTNKLRCDETIVLVGKDSADSNTCSINTLKSGEVFILQSDGSWVSNTNLPSCNLIKVGRLVQIPYKGSPRQSDLVWRYSISAISTGDVSSDSICASGKRSETGSTIDFDMKDLDLPGFGLGCKYINVY